MTAAKTRKGEATDPARSLALLWGSHAKPGRSGLQVRSIVSAAIELADAKGLDAVSMRQLAEALEVGTMSLYTHIPGKGELTDLMVDAVCGELYQDGQTPSQQPGWREALRFVATRNWEMVHRHPWLLDIVATRPVLGPNGVLKYEMELRPLDGQGLTDVEMDSVLSLIASHVEGSARSRANAARVQRESGMTDLEWWVATAPILDKIIDPSRFPVATRVGMAAGIAYQASSNPDAFQFGLERILDGVALLIAERRRRASGEETPREP